MPIGFDGPPSSFWMVTRRLRLDALFSQAAMPRNELFSKHCGPKNGDTYGRASVEMYQAWRMLANAL